MKVSKTTSVQIEMTPNEVKAAVAVAMSKSAGVTIRPEQVTIEHDHLGLLGAKAAGTATETAKQTPKAKPKATTSAGV